jgi:hypothetical protein
MTASLRLTACGSSRTAAPKTSPPRAIADPDMEARLQQELEKMS